MYKFNKYRYQHAKDKNHNTADTYDLVKGTAYAIAQSARVSNARTR